MTSFGARQATPLPQKNQREKKKPQLVSRALFDTPPMSSNTGRVGACDRSAAACLGWVGSVGLFVCCTATDLVRCLKRVEDRFGNPISTRAFQMARVCSVWRRRRLRGLWPRLERVAVLCVSVPGVNLQHRNDGVILQRCATLSA